MLGTAYLQSCTTVFTDLAEKPIPYAIIAAGWALLHTDVIDRQFHDFAHNACYNAQLLRGSRQYRVPT